MGKDYDKDGLLWKISMEATFLNAGLMYFSLFLDYFFPECLHRVRKVHADRVN